MGLQEEIEELEQEIAETPYNKSTEQHIGRLKAKLAEKKEQLEQRDAGSGGCGGYAVRQQGDATVALVGFPSVGKSTLLNALTNAESEVGAYEFTTLDVNPGMLKYRGAEIQLLDVPGLVEGAAGGRGGGREVLSVVRTADLVVILVSPFEPAQVEKLRDELYENRVRLDTTAPDVTIHERERGGIRVTAAAEFTLDEATVEEVLRERGVVNADVTLREDVDVDRLIDAVMDDRVYLPSIVAVNKIDLVEDEYLSTVEEQLRNFAVNPAEAVYISAETESGLENLRERLWSELDLFRVYLDKPGSGVDRDEPLVLRGGATVEDALEALGGDFEQRFRFARVSGPSAKHADQQVGLDHQLEDEDILRLVLRK